MINVTKAFRRMLHNNQRNYLAYADITLESGTILNLENENLLTDGFSREDSVSSDESFSALGSAAIGSASVVINDMDGSYADYDFTNAKVVLSVGLDIPENGSTRNETIKLGTYTVDKATYSGNAITLTMLDYMEQFDRPYSGSTLTYPASLDTIVRDACTKCGVTFSSASANFPHKNYVIQIRPDDEAITFRDVLSWASAIAGCFARCNADGQLELQWFNQAALENYSQGYDGGRFDNGTPRYSTGDSLDGGMFNPWTTGSAADGGAFTDEIPIHYIYGLFSQNMSVDDVVITGVRIIVRAADLTSASGETVYTAGQDGYVIEISGNELITDDNAQEIVTWLGQQLIGLTFRKATVTHGSDPSIEAGDVGLLWDRKGNVHPILITRVTFGIGTSQTIACGAETPSRNSATRYSAYTKAYVENRKALKRERTAWEAAQEDLEDQIENAAGLYHTEVTTLGGTIHYLHNKGPNGEAGDTTGLTDSDIRIMISDVGITMTANGTDPNPIWYGMTVDGTLIASIMNTIGINFNWGTGGTLTLGGDDNVNGLLIMQNASGTEIGRWSKDGISAINAIISGVLTAGAGSSISGLHVNAAGMYSNTFESYDSYIYGDRTGFFFGNDGSISIFTANGDAFRYSDSELLIASETRISSTEYDRLSISPGYYKIENIKNNQVNHGLSISKNRIETNDANSNYTRIEPDSFIVNNTPSTNKSVYVQITPNLITAFSNAYGTQVVSRYDVLTGNATLAGNLSVNGNLSVTGTKPRLVTTEDYGKRFLYAYETPTPMFGDVGEGVIGEDGLCYVSIDPVFAETISNTPYQVFLQTYGEGEVFIKERRGGYFIVQGTPDLAFGWEIKAKQAGYEMYRIDQMIEKEDPETVDYGDLASRHIAEITNERMGQAA